ncbi:TlpA family protein disulfide reductase [Sphingomicrobium nitratireducens]|uniref:TlpA family protein disulfide reductase n=1 Tax=Sphingomicrobium nitratireducens TaxID=2964666 RepID=UPI002240DCDB|nr:TlpA disulfide reductase family protein [Sphingomicrobium nitratireducens]
MTRFLLMLLAAFSLAACDAGHDGTPTPTLAGAGLQREFVGSELPAISVTTPDGKQVPLADIAGGEPLLVNLWASWCAPCVEELPTLAALAAREGAPAVLTLNQDMGPQSSVEAFIEEKGLEGIEAWQDPAMAMTDALAVQVMPTTVLYGSDGREIWRYVGDLDWTGEEAATLLGEAR